MAEEKKSIFRQESLDSISSPEQLTDYLRVTNPGIWIILAAFILFVIGIAAWNSLGRLETTMNAPAVVKDGMAAVFISSAEDAEKLNNEMTLRIDDNEYSISNIETADNGMTVAMAPVNEPDGTYEAKIVTESVPPIRFLLR